MIGTFAVSVSDAGTVDLGKEVHMLSVILGDVLAEIIASVIENGGK